MPFAPVPDLIAAIKAGRMVVLVDDEDRENEGDLIIAAEHADPKAIAFMATKGCGLICLAMEGRMLDRLGLPMMSRENRSRMATAFTVSIEAKDGIATGISAADRSRTVQVAIADDARPDDIVTPGHVFPLRAREGGVLVRTGHSEASVDLARLAGLKPAAVICEIMRPDGEMARLPDLETYCAEHGLLLGTIADLIAWRERTESLISLAGESRIDTSAGSFRAFTYRDNLSGQHHLALVGGEQLGPGRMVDDPVLVRVQKSALLSDVFGIGSGVDPRACLRQIASAGDGVFLYIADQHGTDALRGIHDAPGSQASSAPRLVMDHREYGIGAQILHQLGVRRMRLLANTDRTMAGLSGHGLVVVERVRPTP